MSFAGGGEVVGEAYVEVRALIEKAIADVDGLRADFEKAGNRAGEAYSKGVESKASAKLQEFGKKATAAVSLPLIAGLGLATKAASDLGESANATGLIFGEVRGEIDEFAKHAATSVGVSERSFRDLTTNVGGLLTALGLTREEAAKASIDLVKIGADLGSAYNAEPAEAVEALGAALRGETEAARRFNVVIDQQAVAAEAVKLGLIAQGEELTKTAQTQATLSLITQQTANVQGDFANTSDGAANKQRILRAELEDTAAKIGANLLPAFTGILNVAEDVIGFFSNLGPGATTAGVGIAGIAVAAGPVAGAIGNVIAVAEKVGPKLSSMSLTSVGAFGVAAVAAGAFAKAVIDSRQHVNDLYDDLNQGTVDKSSFSSIREEVKATREEFERQSEEFRRTQHDLGPLGAATQQFIENITPLKNRLQENSDAVGEGRDRLDEFEEAQGRANEALNVAAARLGLTRVEVETLANKNRVDLTGSFEDVQKALADAKDATSIHTTAVKEDAEVTEVFASKTASAEEKLKAFKSALDEALGGHLSVTEASIRHQEAIAKLTETVAENGTATDLLTEKGRNVQSALNDVISSAEGEVEALVKSGKITEGTAEQKQALIQRLVDLEKRFPALKGPIDEYVNSIAAIPAERVTKIEADTKPAETGFEQLRTKLEAGAIKVKISLRDDILKADLERQMRADGGRVAAGRSYIVGEKRAEWFTPDVSGTISSRVPAGLGDGGQGVNVTIPVTIQGDASAATVEAFRQAARDEIGPVVARTLQSIAAGAGTR